MQPLKSSNSAWNNGEGERCEMSCASASIAKGKLLNSSGSVWSTQIISMDGIKVLITQLAKSQVNNNERNLKDLTKKVRVNLKSHPAQKLDQALKLALRWK